MNYQLSIDGMIGPWGWSKQAIRNVLCSYTGKHMDVCISSLGGNLDHALDIRQQFKDHGDITVYLSGFVASAATVIAMGAKRIVMSKYAMFLVHKCSNFIDAWGSYNADEMQKLIEDLEANKKENDKIDVVLANMYADRCKKKVSEILEILKEGRWLNAHEALALGFIDEIAEHDGEPQKLNTASAEQYASFLGKLNALGISTMGLMPPVSESEQKPANPSTMKKFNFATVESLLKMDSITPDNDREVTVTAEQLEQINNRLEELEQQNSANSAAIEQKNAEIEELKAQVKNLKEAPGDDTTEIEDSAEEKTTSADLFNSIKNCI